MDIYYAYVSSKFSQLSFLPSFTLVVLCFPTYYYHIWPLFLSKTSLLTSAYLNSIQSRPKIQLWTRMNTTVSLALGKHSTFLLLSSLHRPHPRSDTQGSAHRVVLDIVPNALAADDAPAQDVVALAVDDRSYHHSARQKFNELPVRKVPLSRYRDIFDRKLPSKAIDLMRHRTESFIGPEWSYDALHPNLAWA